VLAVDIEGHTTSTSGESWAEKIKRSADSIGLFDDDTETRVETRGRKKKTAINDEFSTLVIAVLTLILSFSNMPDPLKPNQSELSMFSNHLTGILLRHLPISGKLSADSLDIIGIVAVCSGYYARIAPEIKNLKPGDTPPPPPPPTRPTGPTPQPKPVSIDPIEKISPATSQFLERVINKAAENATDNG